MKIIETYGNYIEKWSNENPGRARWLLKTGWKAQNLKFRFAPDKRLMSAEQYLARLMMDTMIRPLERPEESAIVSIFTPCEILQEAGLHPYNVEGFSCYLSASGGEYGHIRDTLQLSQDIYRSGAEESTSETKVYCIHEFDL